MVVTSRVHCTNSLSLSVLTAIFQVNWVSRYLLKQMMMEVVVTTGAKVMQSASQIITTNKPTSSFYLHDAIA